MKDSCTINPHPVYTQCIILANLWLMCVLFSVITIKFNQSTYNIYEDNGPVKPVLILSNISLIEFTVEVLTASGSANGKFITQWTICGEI